MPSRDVRSRAPGRSTVVECGGPTQDLRRRLMGRPVNGLALRDFGEQIEHGRCGDTGGGEVGEEPASPLVAHGQASLESASRSQSSAASSFVGRTRSEDADIAGHLSDGGEIAEYEGQRQAPSPRPIPPRSLRWSDGRTNRSPAAKEVGDIGAVPKEADARPAAASERASEARCVAALLAHQEQELPGGAPGWSVSPR